MKDVVLTPAGLEKIKLELSALKQRRKEIVVRIQTAKEFGDLSENAEYDDARNEQSFVEGRIQELDEMIKHAKIVEKTTKGSGKINVGSTVTVSVEGDEEVYEIVGANESDPAKGKVSIDSPIGAALYGASKGETVVVKTPTGKFDYKIVTVN